ncbi:hypothetical protein EZS27_021331 [termite gut metagenome]|uniref:Uncharacterized protein n=1 Tax=termite gut metagenome TaxID=433724 RepID=A0A5J4R9C9_9ZZZZ
MEETHWVYNVKGSSRFPIPSGFKSWLDYWKKHAERPALFCSNVACGSKNNLVGGHVRKATKTDGKYYIVPLCDECNNYNNEDKFKVTSVFVSVPSNL